MLQLQLGNRSRTAEALQVATSIFYDGMEKFQVGDLPGALEFFEQALAINLKYLLPAASSCVLCCNNIAAVHERLGNLEKAAGYYARAKEQLSSRSLPPTERSSVSRRKRAELLQHVQQKLDLLPRSSAPQVGAGMPLAEARQRFASLCAAGELHLQACLDPNSSTSPP